MNNLTLKRTRYSKKMYEKDGDYENYSYNIDTIRFYIIAV